MVLLHEYNSASRTYTELERGRDSKGALPRQKGKRNADEIDELEEEPAGGSPAPEEMFDGGLREWHKEHDYLVEKQSDFHSADCGSVLNNRSR